MVQEKGWGAVYLENHDQNRSVNKYIPEKDIGYYSKTMLASLFLFLRGTLTREQMRKFLKFVHDDNVYCKYYEVVYILFHTGLRISEFCRHTYCSNMAKSSMNPKTLQYLMGHSDIGVTLNTYTHLGLEDATDELKRMEELADARKELEKAKEDTVLLRLEA